MGKEHCDVAHYECDCDLNQLKEITTKGKNVLSLKSMDYCFTFESNKTYMT